MHPVPAYELGRWVCTSCSQHKVMYIPRLVYIGAVCHWGSGQCHNVFIITDVWTCVEGGPQPDIFSVCDVVCAGFGNEVCSEDQ